MRTRLRIVESPVLSALVLLGCLAGAYADQAAVSNTASSATGRVAWAQAISAEGLPNLHKVSDALYRGAQPEAKGFQSLKALGVRTVINLRASHSDLDDMAGMGMTYVAIPMKTWQPKEEDVVRFLQVATVASNAPVFVHCRHGADRTGLMCAMYRVFVCGWAKEEAIREMTEGGFGFHAVWDNIVNFIRALDTEAIRRKMAAAPEPLGGGAGQE